MSEFGNDCIRCGLCLNSCPTYRVLGEELDSPRGRIYQMTAAAAGELPRDAEMAMHLDRCLDCRACETACPSGVRYGRMLEEARAAWPRRGRAWRAGLLGLAARPGWRRAAGAGLRAWEGSSLQAWARRSGTLRGLGCEAAERLCPAVAEGSFQAEVGQVFAAEGERRARVIFFPGCLQNELLPEVNRATVQVLRQHGCEVAVEGGAGCCGALHVHSGERAAAQQLARRNLSMLGTADAVVVNAAGCGATMKAYGEVAGEAGERFGARVRDVTEWLEELGLRRERLGALALVASYQDACHLAHAQGVRAAPRNLLRAIPGLELRELERPDQCCGSAGIYNLTQTAIAAELLRDRVEAFGRTRAEVLVTANTGCLLQLAAGVGRARAVHVVELLEAAGRAAQP